MTWHTYEISPIDFGWENLKTVRETAAALIQKGNPSTRMNDLDTTDLQVLISSWESAKEAAAQKGWEGDLRNEPAVIWLPDESEFRHGFVLKQDNNGTTYVVSPVKLAWLEA